MTTAQFPEDPSWPKDPGRVFDMWYRALLPDGSLWMETRFLEDLFGPHGQEAAPAPLRFERMVTRLLADPWEPFTPDPPVEADEPECGAC